MFAVFDGHGGREVACYCSKYYPKLLEDTRDIIKSDSEREWLRKSFLTMDEMLLTPEADKEIKQLRKEKP